ncbi:MAG: MBL fold metallo-hydrolase [Alphaproteobacteria bacterium]|nr:MBL fold metallo-hydrolase [Alphaproteobacteria bacterium]
MNARVTVLGCGTSGGVPQLHIGWGQCDPGEPKNRRSRCAILIEHQGQSILIDTTPECRLQLYDRDVSKISSLIYTHTHADHCHGIDETRWICQARDAALPTFSFVSFLEDLKQRFPYAWWPMREGAKFFYKPMLLPQVVEPMRHFESAGMTILPFELDHGYSFVLGFRIGNFAYCTDVLNLSEENFAALEGVKIWIIDCLRKRPHPTHAHLERTLGWISRLNPERAYLTHMNGDMDYQELLRTLPDGVEPGYDGLEFTFDPA